MSDPFDVFQIKGEGAVLWVGSAATLEDARQQIRDLAEGAPGSYIILNQKTGEKTAIDISGRSPLDF